VKFVFDTLRTRILAEEDRQLEKEAFGGLIEEAGDFDDDIEELLGIDDADLENVDIDSIPEDSEIDSLEDDEDEGSEEPDPEDMLEEGKSILDRF
jgi:hypothetical protein